VNLLSYFPEKEIGGPARSQQTEGLEFTQGAFDAGINIVVVEAPVGSGKSAMGMAISRALGGGIVACPTVALQNQYLKDFKNTAPLIGRSRFPCLKKDPKAKDSIPAILEGKIPVRPHLDFSCASAPCLNKPRRKQQRIKAECEADGGCPHQHSLDVAQDSETIISNLHSLMYSVSLSDRISKRRVLVIDECHDLQAFMRDFLKVKFKVRRKVLSSEISNLKTVDQWFEWLRLPEQLALLTSEDMRDSYLERLERLSRIGDAVFQTWDDEKDGTLWIELTPIHVGAACRTMLFSLAEKVVLMSGTIYSKEMFLRPLGIDPDKAAFTRISSDFPVANRPIVLPRRKTLDLSHKNWTQNFGQAVSDIKHLMSHHSTQKGLIHTSSYRMSREICEALDDPRIMTHESENFNTQLEEFYASDEPRIFVSPVISQGVDFKDDLARWQILIRPRYATISDPYVKHLLDAGGWPTYFYMTAVVFGQETGRIVRSNTDSGVTYLLSSTFLKLISKSNHLLPLWQKQGFIQ
jgi:Rad3-related DNA helicase